MKNVYIEEKQDHKNKRSTLTFADRSKGLNGIYQVKFRDKLITRYTLPLQRVPLMEDVMNAVSQVSGKTFVGAATLKYPHGAVGISPHRDKEIPSHMSIYGLSTGGATRRLVVRDSRSRKILLDLPLPPGSLYGMNPPTNSRCLHEIAKDKSSAERISVTFREGWVKYEK
jgi:alkylated DNA repair dioxygenase AlkB